MRRAAITIAALVLVGCVGDLDPPSLVDRTRIVAARVSPDRDRTIAEPSPGDTITIEWLTITPGEPEPIAASLLACRPLGGTGAPACAEGSIVPLAGRAPSTDPFVTTATVPSEIEGAWLVLGAVCAGGGTPGIPMGTTPPECEGGPDARRADVIALSIPIAVAPMIANRHPSITDEPWTLDGTAWDAPPTGLALEGCAARAGDASLPSIAVTLGRAIPITIGWSDDDRESYEGGREALQVSHFATAGELARSNSAADDLLESGTPVAIDWTLPPAEEVPAEGLLVRMTAIVRDGRGGVDRADRALCVVP